MAAASNASAPNGHANANANGNSRANNDATARRANVEDSSSSAFGLEKLSLKDSSSAPASSRDKKATAGAENGKSHGAGAGDEVAAENAQNSVKFLEIGNEDDAFIVPSSAGAAAKSASSAGANSGSTPNGHGQGKMSVASAALDLAPLAQTSQRFNQRPFETGLKTSEWPQFSGPPKSATDGLNGSVSGASGAAAGAGAKSPSTVSRKESPNGLADSVASLPAMPTRSVPGTPGAGLNGAPGSNLAGFASMRGSRNQASSGFLNPSGSAAPGMAVGGGIAGGPALEGLSSAQRGYSNPDLSKAFSKVGGGFGALGADGPRPYGQADPLYGPLNMNAPPAALGNNAAIGGHFNGYDAYGFDDDSFGSGALYPGGGGMGNKNKRAEMDREFNRFSGMRIEDLQGELLTLCKDQHGCRYLQKKLEEQVPEHRDMIFRETYGHFSELMTDPFGNYLCQKLLEYATEEQRNVICESVANDLVAISLNMHGTRAVQKMIDFLSNPRQPNQIRSIILALSLNVVSLIKDLNGNHVIQKCLNRLVPEDNQFIYNAVAAHCVEVATHRHGCCVLQRCIDHAADAQRVQLVTEITYNALPLVQDPFGNYVVQYVLDLNDHRFSEPLIRQFVGNVCALSVQKFSSNVIEKCIRVADPDLRRILVGELLNRSRLEKLLRDSFANYVVQTALDYAEPSQRMVLVEHIRPILPMIRNTPYGKRIQSKLQREQMGGPLDHYGGGASGYGNNYMSLGNNHGSGFGMRGGYGRGGYNNHAHHYDGSGYPQHPGGGFRGGGMHHHPGPHHGHHQPPHHAMPPNDAFAHHAGSAGYGGYGAQNGMNGAYNLGYDQRFGPMAGQHAPPPPPHAYGGQAPPQMAAFVPGTVDAFGNFGMAPSPASAHQDTSAAGQSGASNQSASAVSPNVASSEATGGQSNGFGSYM